MLKLLSRLFINLMYAFIAFCACGLILGAAGVSKGYSYAWLSIVLNGVFLGYYAHQRPRYPEFSFLPLLGARPVTTAAWSLSLAVLAFLVIVAGVGATHGTAHIDPGYDWTRITALVFIVLAAAEEEVICRSYLFALLTMRFRMGIVVLLTALLFTLMHYPYVFINPFELIGHFIFSLCMSTLTIRFNSLLPATIFHAVYNYCVGLKRLDVGAPLDHPGVFVWENLGVANVFSVFVIVVFSAISLALWPWIVATERRKTERSIGRPRC